MTAAFNEDLKTILELIRDYVDLSNPNNNKLIENLDVELASRVSKDRSGKSALSIEYIANIQTIVA